ncbi:hypothetical protein EOD41_14905 [Mucilaginibacter limnophilus]|uniref:Peptidase C39 domain-containing protein n=1 Tax=Mucilaginibacter limnophilus TaxID=1932778 RepID=A0A437MQ20_9SPHI|nr:cysteine peptidase family C39 domain-containing protein [Mucilaginibacter limnophilus]RVT99731.1 hypothetical protein EOD41_14905 [Mucilaginibacter limnophilus]
MITMDHFRHIRQAFQPQLGSNDCGQAALQSLLSYLGINIKYNELLNLLPPDKGGVSLLDLKRTAGLAGMNATCLKAEIDDLERLELPAILHVSNELRAHFMVYYKRRYSKGVVQYMIGDPSGYISFFDREKLEAFWQVNAVLVVKDTKAGYTAYSKTLSVRDLFMLHGRFPVILTTAIIYMLLSLPVFVAFTLGHKLIRTGDNYIIWIMILGGSAALAKTALAWISNALTSRSEERVQDALKTGFDYIKHSKEIPLVADEPTRLTAAFRSLTATILPDLIFLAVLIISLGSSNWYIPAVIGIYVTGIMSLRWRARYALLYNHRQLADLNYIADTAFASGRNATAPAVYKRRVAVLDRCQRAFKATERRNQVIIDLFGISMLLVTLPAQEKLFGGPSIVTFLFIIYVFTGRLYTELPKFFQGVIALEDYHRRMHIIACCDPQQAYSHAEDGR